MSRGFPDELRQQCVLPVVRTASAGEAVEAAFTLIDAGLTMLELTATTPDWETQLHLARSGSPSRADMP